MVIELRVSTSPPPTSLGIIIFPLQRQLPTALPKALVSAGSGFGMPPCGAPEPLPVFPVVSCWACAASASEHRTNNSRFISSLLRQLVRTLPRRYDGGNNGLSSVRRDRRRVALRVRAPSRRGAGPASAD